MSIPRRHRALSLVWLGAGLLLLGACTGQGSGEPGSPEDGVGGEGGAGGTGMGGTGGTAMKPPPKTCSPALAMEPGPQVIRRLTRFEYNNTIRDLFGDAVTKITGSPAREFPVEEQRLGFDNNAAVLTVSPLLAEKYLASAESIARAFLTANAAALPAALGCDPAMVGEDVCAGRFIARMGRRAFRRALTTEEEADFRELYAAGKTGGFNEGIKLMLMAVLQSPSFLYRVEGVADAGKTGVVPVTPLEMASRLSYFLWGSQPDSALLAAAESNKLTTPAEIATQAKRLLADKRARDVIANFHQQWLELNRLDAVQKDPAAFPGYDPGVIALYKTEADMFVREVVLGEGSKGDLEALFTAKYTFANATMAKFLGLTYPDLKDAEGKAITSFQKVEVDGVKRAGFLTLGGVLTVLASANQTNPVLRGKFVREQLLCQMLPPPPENVNVVLPALSKSLTTRQRFVAHSENDACRSCHQMMDPIGFGFERFDGVGRYRETENGKAVDASGEVIGMPNGKFNGVVDLANKLFASDQVRECVATQWFRYALGRSEDVAVDECSLAHAQQRFIDSNYKIQELLLAVTETEAFRRRRMGPAPGGTP